MQLYFAPAIDKYFAAWILPSTWYTSDQRDDARFYRFVMAVFTFSNSKKRSREHDASAHPRLYDERSMRENIFKAAISNHRFNKKAAVEQAEQYATKAMLILDFLWTIKKEGFPLRPIQKWDPPLK